MSKKTTDFTKQGIQRLPNDRPVLYEILTEGGKPNYIGVAKRGRIQERLQEHLRDGKDPVPGVKVQIEQMPSIATAERKELLAIPRNQPKCNKKGK